MHGEPPKWWDDGSFLLHCCLFYPYPLQSGHKQRGSCRDQELNRIELYWWKQWNRGNFNKGVPELRIFFRSHWFGIRRLSRLCAGLESIPSCDFRVGICEALRKQNSEPKGHSSGWGNHGRGFLRPQCEEGCRSKKHLSILGRFLAEKRCFLVPPYRRTHMLVNYGSLRWKIHYYHVKSSVEPPILRLD